MNDDVSNKSHSFASRFNKAKGREKIAFFLLRSVTYLVLFCAGYLFWDIISKGSNKVFEGEGLINWEFLTDDPQTLHVVKINGNELKLSSRKYYDLKDQLVSDQFKLFSNEPSFEVNFSELTRSFRELKMEWSDKNLQESFTTLINEKKARISQQFSFWQGLLEDPQQTAQDFEIEKKAVSELVSGFIFANITREKKNFPFIEKEFILFKAKNFQKIENISLKSINQLESKYHSFLESKLSIIKNQFKKQALEVGDGFDLFVQTRFSKDFIKFEDLFTPYLSAREIFFDSNDASISPFLVAKSPFNQAVSIDLPSEDYAYSGGGIFPAIVGTVLLVTGAMFIAIILGVLSAVFLAEYGKNGRLLSLIRLAILNLAGVPSIIFGLFGFGLFVIFLDWNVSLIAGWFTLAFMVLPVVITSSEEALRSIPQGFREASLALGASKWTMIRTNVIPYALPGILTSSVLGVARAAGETAPIMFTAAYATRSELPWENLEHWTDFFFQGVMALPYHIYVVSAKIPQNTYTADMQYGTALVFLLLVLGLAMTSILFRTKLRKKYRW